MKKSCLFQLFVIIFIFFIDNSNTFELELENESTNVSIIFPNAPTQCPMYSKTCRILIYMQNETKIFSNNSQENHFKFLGVEECQSEDKCNESIIMDLTPFFILIDAIIVGKENISIKQGNNTINTHAVIITSPQRVIDLVHQFYIIIFQTIISAFMGLLLDVKTIVKIIKMPIPVLVGISTQYLGMPLVNILNSAFKKYFKN